ncbi:MAG: GspH/FimT family protein [Woeseiaceae bacterium]
MRHVSAANRNRIRDGRSRQRVAVRSTYTAQHGFNLLELLIALAILGIITAIAVPSFQSVSINSNLSTETNDLVSSLRLARSEAAKQGLNVTVCSANAGLTACSGSADWSTGWLVIDTGGNVIFAREALTADTATEMAIVGAQGSIVFNRNGFSSSARTIKLCGPNNAAERARGVIVSVDGRVRLATDSDNDSVVEDRSGTELACP